MRVNGKTVSGPKVQEIYVDTQQGPVQILLRALTSKDNEEFEATLPRPKPPGNQGPDGSMVFDHSDATYQQTLGKWAMYQIAWNIMRCLDLTVGLEFETVDMKVPETWSNVYEEIEKGLGMGAMNRITEAWNKANRLDDDQVEEAKRSFLALQAPPVPQ